MRSFTRAFACAQPRRPVSDNPFDPKPFARALVAQPTSVVAVAYGFTTDEAGRVKAMVADLLRQDALETGGAR